MHWSSFSSRKANIGLCVIRVWNVTLLSGNWQRWREIFESKAPSISCASHMLRSYSAESLRDNPAANDAKCSAHQIIAPLPKLTLPFTGIRACTTLSRKCGFEPGTLENEDISCLPRRVTS